MAFYIFPMFYSALRACPNILKICGLVFISLQNFKQNSFWKILEKGKLNCALLGPFSRRHRVAHGRACTVLPLFLALTGRSHLSAPSFSSRGGREPSHRRPDAGRPGSMGGTNNATAGDHEPGGPSLYR